MSAVAVVIDYGIGNLFSVRRALEECGAEVIFSSDPRVIMSAPRVVLPGVGAFSDGMRGLVERKLDGVLRAYADRDRPLLGICLGMQMLADVSEEFGEHHGLGIIPGRVRAVDSTMADGRSHKIPHIGWAVLQKPANGHRWENTILEDVLPGEAVYLVHSYAYVPEDEAHRLADVDYNGRKISAAVQRGKIYGCQFHPEKSGAVGLRILKKFLAIHGA